MEQKSPGSLSCGLVLCHLWGERHLSLKIFRSTAHDTDFALRIIEHCSSRRWHRKEPALLYITLTTSCERLCTIHQGEGELGGGPGGGGGGRGGRGEGGRGGATRRFLGNLLAPPVCFGGGHQSVTLRSFPLGVLAFWHAIFSLCG